MKPAPCPSKLSHWLQENGDHSLHLLYDAVSHDPAASSPAPAQGTEIPHTSERADAAIFLLDPKEGSIASWSPGASLLYGYQEPEVIGRHLSFLYGAPDTCDDGTLSVTLDDELTRTASQEHAGTECWQFRENGSRFWASVVTTALRDESGTLQGFARIVRDFSDRRENDQGQQRQKARVRPNPAQSTVAGIVSGEYQRISEASDVFLEQVGYLREDLDAGEMSWSKLAPPEYSSLDTRAHEEGLRFGACTPFEKELIRKDGSRIPVLVVIAVLKLIPFRWMAFVQDLRDRNRFETIQDIEAGEQETKHEFQGMIGNSPALKRILRHVEVVAPTDATVLVLGETGTGKELVARAVHRLSPRSHMPFITLNCAAIPTGLLESELFGYERGAFTGALGQKIGRFEMAHRGTLFLDEVGDIPLELQPKLLRALQEKSFERLGGTKTIPIDVRLVAATNRNLAQMMGDKLFRSDLYYRLKVFPITTPPLRDRPEDIPILARYFVQKYAAEMNRTIDRIPPETMKALVDWNWPGNIRELENFIERSVILSPGGSLRAPLAEIRQGASEPAEVSTLEKVERDHILKVFRECGGVVTTTATRLGLHRTTLNAMMRKLDISRQDL